TGGYGIDISDAKGVDVQGNMIGTDADGKSHITPITYDDLGNFVSGIVVENSSDIQIGDARPVAINVISANGTSGYGSGVDILTSSGVTLMGNRIGTNLDGDTFQSNYSMGVFLSSSSAIVIGKGNAGPDNPQGNVISGNGIGIALFNSTLNHIDGN